MEYRRVYSFVGRRSTTAETTAAATAAHLGVTTHMFFSHSRTLVVPGTFLRFLHNVHHHLAFSRKLEEKEKNTEQDQPAVRLISHSGFFHHFSKYSTPTFVVVLLVVNQRSKLHT